MAQNPRLAVAQLRLAAQQGQQHPFASLVQGGMQGIQFAQNIHARKAQMAAQASQLRILQEQQRMAQQQFQEELKLKTEQEKRAKDLHSNLLKKQAEWEKQAPTREEEAQLRLNQIRNTIQTNEWQQNQRKAQVEAANRMAAGLSRGESHPPVNVPIGLPPARGMPSTSSGNQISIPGLPGPTPKTAYEREALMRMTQPDRDHANRRELQDRDLQGRISLIEREWGHRIKAAAMEQSNKLGVEDKLRIEMTGKAVETLMYMIAQRDRENEGLKGYVPGFNEKTDKKLIEGIFSLMPTIMGSARAPAKDPYGLGKYK